MKNTWILSVLTSATLWLPVACSKPGTAVSPADSKVLIIGSESEFDQLVVQADRPVLVDFWATWCPPCRAMEPVIKSTPDRFKDAIRVAKVDIDQNRDMAEKFNIRAVPTLMLYHQGKAVAVHEGAMGQSGLDQWIQQQLQQTGVSL